MLIYAIEPPDARKLEEVVARMRVLGAPIIRAIKCDDHYVALEGSHRLAAASVLGVVPRVIVHQSDELIDITAYDWFDHRKWNRTHAVGREVAQILHTNRAVGYGFPDAADKPTLPR